MTWSLTIRGYHPMNSNLQVELDDVKAEAREMMRKLRERGHVVSEAAVNNQVVQEPHAPTAR